MIEPEDVVLEEPLKVLGRRRDLVKAEELPHQADIGASRKLQAFEPIRDFEFGGERLGKSLHPRAARVDQRAVNIK